jgi:hypothetical protein
MHIHNDDLGGGKSNVKLDRTFISFFKLVGL